MKQKLVLFLVFGLALSYNFTDYVIEFGRIYATPEEADLRQQIFESNYSRILESNSLNLGYTLAPNKFTDRTEAEMKRRRINIKCRITRIQAKCECDLSRQLPKLRETQYSAQSGHH